MILVIVHSVTAVFIYTIDQIIKQDGNNKKILKEPKNKDGGGLTIQI